MVEGILGLIPYPEDRQQKTVERLTDDGKTVILAKNRFLSLL